ncbi:Uma2 family endonuclease [Laspinema olomoucense]|uniref:Uma2 family endonuclease n=1 Tax=Laspinema olomoucense TaxID=3231600 RepID=UPI0021BAAE61|nr:MULTISPECIES: Uma2 family endonuclease [unclassified Laspinema]MCT7991272.1 Uma2 family endonuclease [Laspinema sp. D3a]MCT7996383.1 Uma2 family endonuclease [Laspinema sp. D3c]
MDDEPTTLTFLDYLELEKTSSVRHDYIAGQLFEIETLSPQHDRLAINIGSGLYDRLRDTNCQVFTVEMKLWIPKADVAYYPDVMVVCEPSDGHPQYKTQPRLIVEVLSSNTVATDRQEKFLAYQTLPSFQEYILVPQEKMPIEIYRKNPLGNWEKTLGNLEKDLYLESLGLTLPLTEIYEDSLIE